MARLAGLFGSLFAITLGATVSSPAAAQYGGQSAPQQMPQTPPTPSSQGQQAATAATTRADVLRAAGCVTGRDTEAADALLATAPFSGDEREKAVRLLRTAQRCLHASAPIATSALMIRGAVAEKLYEARFAEAATARSPATAALPNFQPANVAGLETAALITSHYQLAACAAPARPDLVRALLATEPGTDAEGAALTALHPAFRNCVPAGTQISLDHGAIRGMLAEALYRWSVVQRDGAASAWAAPAAPTAPTATTAANPGG
jgi:hypothetical protein